MKFFSKNKILSLLSVTLCLQIFSEITIPIEKAYKQLCQQELGLNQLTLIASLEMDIEELKTDIYVRIQEQIDKSLPYDEIKLPQIIKPNIISLPYKAEHVTSISTKTGGYVFWRKALTKTVEYAKVDYDGSTITTSEVRSISGSSFTGDGITAACDLYGNTAATWNR